MAGNQKGPLDPKRFDHGERRKQYLRTPATSKKQASEPFSNSLLGPKGSLPELPIRSPTSCKVNQPFTQVQRLFGSFEIVGFSVRHSGDEPLPSVIHGLRANRPLTKVKLFFENF